MVVRRLVVNGRVSHWGRVRPKGRRPFPESYDRRVSRNSGGADLLRIMSSLEAIRSGSIKTCKALDSKLLHASMGFSQHVRQILAS